MPLQYGAKLFISGDRKEDISFTMAKGLIIITDNLLLLSHLKLSDEKLLEWDYDFGN